VGVWQAWFAGEGRGWRAGRVRACLVLVGLVVAFGGRASGALAQACANAAFRVGASGGLPDCRAYELVSPPFTDGQIPESNGVVAADGSSIAFASTGGFGEAEDDLLLGSTYLATRGSGGWSVRAVEPPSSEFQNEYVLGGRTADFNPQLTESLFGGAPVGSPAPAEGFYLEQLTAGLPFVEVGPAVSPVRVAEFTGQRQDFPEELLYVGASADLSHVLFRILNVGVGDWLWPGDETIGGHPSLYEWVGAGHTGVGGDVPALVGVSDGHTVVEGRVLGAGTLISQCGILLGSQTSTENPTLGSSDDTYNAVSEDGSRVFFTAVSTKGCGGEGPAFDEVYARTGGSVTTAVSEPSKADCAACETEGARSGAYFQGASSDGSKVFFLSEQKLFGGLEGEAGDNLYEFNFDPASEGWQEDEKVSLVAPETALSKGERSGVMRVSENGGLVYLVSEDAGLAGNVDADGTTAQETVQKEDEEGKLTHDLMFVFNTVTRQFTFVAALAQSDQSDWNDNDTRRVEATPDGRFLLFGSSNDLTPGAEGAGSQLYRFDAEPGGEEQAKGVPRLVRVSIGQEGYDHDGNTGDIDVMTDPEDGGVQHVRPRAVSITNDGTRVFFESEAALVPGALNNACVDVFEGECINAINVYEWEQAGVGSCPENQTAGCVYQISENDDHVVLDGPTVHLIGADATGENVFFTTADQLVPQDTSGQDSIYDARINGGFPPPPAPSSCESEACQPAASPPSAPATPTSTTENSERDIPPNPPPPAAPLASKAAPAPTRAQKLAKALKTCRKDKSKAKRAACEKQAQHKYGATTKTKRAKTR
jgi:hypothetical protein